MYSTLSEHLSKEISNLYLTNSLSHQKEKFVPIIPNQVGMYVCGPTVYDRPHLGNVRSAVVYDILYRLLRYLYDKVIYVRNITDIDDKIIDKVKESGEPMESLTKRMTDYYHDDLWAVGCLNPNIEPRATDHLPEMIAMIGKLVSQGQAYVAEGHVLFSVESYDEYGKLSGRNIDEMIAGARIEVAPYKKHPADFVLWKPVRLGFGDDGMDYIAPDPRLNNAMSEELQIVELCERRIKQQDLKMGTGDVSFASPWGSGRPGWHIECSAMSCQYLGSDFDIHGGGVDLIFPHHENELAQSTCAEKGSTYARYWIHNGFLTVNGEKMSKSLGNFRTVRELLDKGVPGVVLRYFYMTAHYRKPLDYNAKAIDDALKAVTKFARVCGAINYSHDRDFDGLDGKHSGHDTDVLPMPLPDKALQALCDDLNTPALLAYMHELAAAGASEELAACCAFIGLDLAELRSSIEVTGLENIPEEIISLAEQRHNAREEKDWARADDLKRRILDGGYEIRDGVGGHVLVKL